MEPTVGRMVYYKSYGTPGGEFPSVERAAVITAVRPRIAVAWYVDLCVFNPTGLFFNQQVRQGDGPGEWDWMPFQKGQAAREEELLRDIMQDVKQLAAERREKS